MSIQTTIGTTVGITGGIAMGKTTVSNHLHTVHHLTVLDADRYARQAVEPGSPILKTIIDRYTSHILLPDSTLDRPQLGQIIFNNPTERQWLEAQIHPYVRQHMQADRDAYDQKSPLILVIPLLFETNMTHLVDQIWVIRTSPDRQIQHLITRDHLTPAQAQARINAQMPIEQKCAQASVILDNSSTVDHLLAQVDHALLNLANLIDRA
jgi:dephospho-CoA kinase